MKKLKLSGLEIKRDNGSGLSLARGFPKRRFHDDVIYEVQWHGVQLDGSTVTAITRSRDGWGK